MNKKKLMTLSAAYFFECAAITGLSIVITSIAVRQNGMSAYLNTLLGIMTIGTFLTSIIGGILGDLLLSRKTTMLAGAGLTLLGAMILCINIEAILLISITLIILGHGLVRSNLFSSFGLQIKGKENWLDSGYTFLRVISILGGLLGGVMANMIQESEILKYVVILILFLLMGAAIGYFYILSRFPPPLNLQPSFEEGELVINKEQGFSVRPKLVISAILVLMVFLGATEFQENLRVQLYSQYDKLLSIYQFTTIGTLVIGLIFTLLWFRFHFKSVFKVSIGVTLASLAFFLFYLVDKTQEFTSNPLFLISLALLIIAELLIIPSVIAIVNRHTNKKYLSTINSIVLIPRQTFSYLFMLIYLLLFLNFFN